MKHMTSMSDSRLLTAITLGLIVIAASVASARVRSESDHDADRQSDHPPELGAVAWGRDFAAAQAQSKQSGKPLVVLFQEVPG